MYICIWNLASTSHMTLLPNLLTNSFKKTKCFGPRCSTNIYWRRHNQHDAGKHSPQCMETFETPNIVIFTVLFVHLCIYILCVFLVYVWDRALICHIYSPHPNPRKTYSEGIECFIYAHECPIDVLRAFVYLCVHEWERLRRTLAYGSHLSPTPHTQTFKLEIASSFVRGCRVDGIKPPPVV